MIKKNLILLSLILTMSANTTPIFANSINEKLSNNTVYFDEISIANKTLDTLKKQQNKQLKEIESKQVEVDTLFYNKSSAEKNQKETKKRAEKATEDYNKTLNKLENAKELFTNNQNTILHLKNKITQNPTKDTVKEISTLKFKQIKQAKIVTDLESSVNTQAVVTKLTTEQTQKNEYKIDNLQKEYESKSTELSDSFENKAEIKQEINNINITVQDSQKKALELKKNSFDLDEESRKEKEEKYRLPTDEELKLIIAENERRKAEEAEAARLAAEEAARIEAEKKAQEEALKKAISSYKKENSRLDSAEKEYADKYLAWKEARKTYENTSDRYVAAQAAILAAGLKDGMPCPVCGSTNHTQPAAMTKDTVTKEELDEAKSKENECEKEKNNSQKIFEDNKRKKDVAFAEVKRYYEICYYLGDKADTSLKDKKGYNASLKDKTDTDIKEHENIRQQENIKDKEYTSFGKNKTDKLEENVKTKIKEIKKSLTENEQTIEDLYSKKEEKLKREKAEKETEAKLKEMEENIADNAEMLNKQSVSVGSLSAEMEMLKKELSYESSDIALKELENIRNKIEVLEKRKRELDENILKSDRTKSNLNGTIKENKNQLETDRKNLETEYDDFIKVLKEKEFENEEAYNESLVHIESIEIFDRQIQEYKEEVSKVSSLISVLDDMLDGEKEIDTDVMLQQKAEMEIEAERLANENEITVSKLGTNNSVRDKVSKLMEQRGKLNEKYKIISSLNSVANSKKIHFQTFVLRQYFNMVISYANKRLAVMTSNGFLLKCRDISLTTAGETGLELDVYSPVTGKVRDAHSLSGGETFMASLAMALGMSDIVQNNSGKTQIDTMFIDEGFGSLSDDVRDKAVKILLDLAGSSRLVGVISHVSELKEQIPSKIIVRKDNDGSHITWVQDR